MSLSTIEDLNDTGPDADLDSSVGSIFWPLRPCKRTKVEDPIKVDGSFANVGVFQADKRSDNASTVLGTFDSSIEFIYFYLLGLLLIDTLRKINLCL